MYILCTGKHALCRARAATRARRSAVAAAPAARASMLLHLLLLLVGQQLLHTRVFGLDNGLALTPPQAWTSWDLCRFEVNASTYSDHLVLIFCMHCFQEAFAGAGIIKEVALALNATGLQKLGWNTLQIDEGWEACAEYTATAHFDADTTCKTKAPRDAQGAIVANSTKFPGGIKPLADWLHARGFKIGIYTSASTSACGGNWGSRGHETADATAFAAWGVDWVKVDNCDYGSWADLIATQRVMSKAIQATGRPMIIQVGAGDHMPLLNNPNANLSDSYARTFEEEAWIWGPEVAHTWYTGNDKQNSWKSTIHNVLQNYRGAETFQKPGAWNFAGDLWCGTPEHGTSTVGASGTGSMSVIEEASTYAMFMIMAAPPMLGCDIRKLAAHTLGYLTNPELLAVNQDAWGVQGSLVDISDTGSHVYAKPLSDGSFAIALLNLGAGAANATVAWSTLGPTVPSHAMQVRDIWRREDRGVHEGSFSAQVMGHGVEIVKVTPAKLA